MTYPFSIIDAKVHVDRYIVSSKSEKFGASTNDQAAEIAAVIGGTVEPINIIVYESAEWMEGIALHSDDPYAEAIRIYEMGEAAYRAQCALAEKSKNEQLRADLDYVMLMGGL